MKLRIFILFALSGGVFAQTTAVTKNPNTNQITGNLVMGANRVFTFDPNSLLSLNGLMRTSGSGDGGKAQINNSGISFGSVDGMLTVLGRDNHGILSRTPNPSDGIALVGWSSSGAGGLKAVQDTHFTSPTITAWRDLSAGDVGFESSPGLLVSASGPEAYSTPLASAFEVRLNSHIPILKISWNGNLLTNGNVTANAIDTNVLYASSINSYGTITADRFVGKFAPLTLIHPASLGTNWSHSGGGVYVSAAGNATGFSGIEWSPSGLVTGSMYLVKFEVTAYTSGNLSVFLDAPGARGFGAVQASQLGSGLGFHAAMICRSSQATSKLHVRANNGFVGTISNITLTKLPF